MKPSKQAMKEAAIILALTQTELAIELEELFEGLGFDISGLRRKK